MKATWKTASWLSAALLLVMLGAAASFFAFRHIEASAQERGQSNKILNNAVDLLSALKDAETGQRGYLLTGKEDFLQPYLAAHESVRGKLQALRRSTASAAARQHLDAIAPLMDAKLAELAELIDLRRRQEVTAVLAAVSGERGKRLMDSIRAEMASFIQIEEAARDQHDAEFQSNLRYLFAIIVAASLLALLFSLAFAYLIFRRSQQHQKNLVHEETQRVLGVQQEMNQKLQQANLTLQISEQKLAVTLNSIGDGVIATDAQGRVTLLNPLAAQLTGWTSAQALGHSIDEIFHIINQESREPVPVPVSQTLAQGTLQALANHTVLVSRDGKERAIADSCAPIRDLAAQVIGAVLVFRDVTDDYATQQALRDSAALVQTILNTVVDGVITFQASSGIIQTVNPAAEQMFGYKATELVGQNLSSRLSPDPDQDQWHGLFETEGTDEQMSHMGLTREVLARRKDGSVFPMELAGNEMWLSGQRFFTAILRDISERKLAQAAQKKVDQSLHQQQFYTRSLIESNIDALITTDAAGLITDVNHEMEILSGYAREVLIGAPFKDYFTDSQRAEDGIKLVLKKKKVADYELTARAKDGKETAVSFNASTFYNRDWQLQGVIVAARDVTERKRLDQLLQERNRELEIAKSVAEKANLAKSEFLATMSHEIRTPMNGVVGMIDVLQQSSLNGPQREMTSIIHDSAFALLAVINDILDFSKIEANKLEIEMIAMSVPEVVEAACDSMRHMATKKNVELTFFIEPATPNLLIGDPGRLRQVLINLVSNAIKFSSRPDRAGQVSVRALLHECHEERVVIEFQVADDGIGMDEMTRAKLFTAFTQADTSTTRKFGGTGLGLAICGQLVQIMGGQVSVQSETNNGSRFSVYLPFLLMPTFSGQNAAATSQGLEPAIEPSAVAGLRCLVLGGRDPMTSDVATYLTHDKAVVERASNLASARQWIDSHPLGVGIVVMDAADVQPMLDQLRDAASSHAGQELHFLLIGRGQRQRPRRQGHDLVLVDRNLLSHKTLTYAVAIAAGRAQPPEREDMPRAVKATPAPIPREVARLNGNLILVAEDNEYNQKVIVQQLMLLGCTTDIAINGLEALTRWQSGDYGILFADLHMPKMDGYELTRAIRAAETGKTRIPIIAFTANALKGEAERCMACGMDDYLCKPVQLIELKAMLDKWLPVVASMPIVGVMKSTRVFGAAVDVTVLGALIGSDETVMRDFLSDFRTSASNIALELRAACRQGEAKAAVDLAHKLKSSARSVGALALGDLCAAIEQAGQCGDGAQLATRLPEFELEMARVDTFLGAY